MRMTTQWTGKRRKERQQAAGKQRTPPENSKRAQSMRKEGIYHTVIQPEPHSRVPYSLLPAKLRCRAVQSTQEIRCFPRRKTQALRTEN